MFFGKYITCIQYGLSHQKGQSFWIGDGRFWPRLKTIFPSTSFAFTSLKKNINFKTFLIFLILYHINFIFWSLKKKILRGREEKWFLNRTFNFSKKKSLTNVARHLWCVFTVIISMSSFIVALAGQIDSYSPTLSHSSHIQTLW
jgi:hypothetical protein